MHTPVYLALDFPTWEESHSFIQSNNLQGVPVKVGMELFYREGPKVIQELKDSNHAIFLDLKLHDIPTTVHKAMKNIAKLGVDLINVHASGGSEMIHAAKMGLVEGTGDGEVPKLLAVTVLTSMDETILQDELHVNESVKRAVTRLAKLANDNGADGVVCSAHEVPNIKEVCTSNFLTVTPGIRLADSEHNDQKRIATPAFAKKNGASAIVIGRSITQAENPKQAYEKALEEWGYVIK
ncbi:orotidine-5'-phosphate decarboxylase [Aquibacillus koreensis]|uniref:Orotidine 5'-phosphate decarboxylase n=1 Tax=Aquibacillus koreensis TaxID=279446 RepID=A0A9X3WKJ8_9BACI|nr:orotidine-5'-phosphate decarboxylase [Aquibacillus koreensis]MCT2538030.1 orotidine-5'-phosphate decarboxylase [Aquibacillus koreensis]MDC3420553.1 orotidine-5'-phosphate decarboxylase [Aquibacillus koreensis]